MEQFRELLREHNLRVTPQREAILRILYNCRGHHLETENIYELIMAKGGYTKKIGLATVYRTMELFKKIGLVSRLAMDNSPDRYELMEVPPYRLPNLKNQLKKVWMRLKCFLKEAIPYVLGGILLINLFHVSGVIAWLGRLFSPLVKGVFGLPQETVAALIIGTVRKDAALALLTPLNLDNMQMVTASIVLTLYFPCVATFTVLFKELGFVDTARAVCIMLMVTVVAGGSIKILGALYYPGVVIMIELFILLLFSWFTGSTLKLKLTKGSKELGG